MLFVKACHISTQAAWIRDRWPRDSSSRKNVSSVVWRRSRPNHTGSPLSRLLTTVRNLVRFPSQISSTPICFKAGRRRCAAQRVRERRSMARTVLAASPSCRPTCRADADSHTSPRASSNRLLKGALLGNCGTRSILTPQSGQRTRKTSTTTVVRYSPQGRSRTSRSLASTTSRTRSPHPEQISGRLRRIRRTHNRNVFCPFVDLVLKDSIPRPTQNLREVVVLHPRSLPKHPRDQNPR